MFVTFLFNINWLSWSNLRQEQISHTLQRNCFYLLSSTTARKFQQRSKEIYAASIIIRIYINIFAIRFRNIVEEISPVKIPMTHNIPNMVQSVVKNR